MGFFDTEEGVDEYLEMAKGHDGRELIEKLSAHLAPGSTVLELGMGPGHDLEILLAGHFRVTGSDSSSLFLERYRAKDPEADLLHLDAVTLETDRPFDCIYSNKVLQHLQREDLVKSVPRQAAITRGRGLACSTPFGTATKAEDISAACISSSTWSGDRRDLRRASSRSC